MHKVNFYKSVTEQVGNSVGLDNVLSKIKNGRYEKLITSCRDALKSGNTKKYKSIKSKLPAITVSAQFNDKRRIDEVSVYNQLVILDFDNVPKGQDWLLADKHIKECEYTYAYFTSPSGNGFKIIVKVDTSLEKHENAFSQVADYYEEFCFEVDQSGKDVTRLCYLSCDKDLYHNPDSAVFSVDLNKVIETEDKIQSKIKYKPIDNIEGVIRSESTELEIAYEIVDYCENRSVSVTVTHEAWYKVAYAIASLGGTTEERIDLFMRLCRQDGSLHDERKSFTQIKYAVKNQNGKIGIGTLIHFAKEVGYELKTQIEFKNQFWYEVSKSDGDNKVHELKINASDFLEWLETRGFFMTLLNGRRDIFKQNGFFIEESSVKEIKTTLLDYVNDLPELVTKHCTQKQLRTCLLNNSSRLMTNSFLEFMQDAKVVEHEDTSSSVYFYFNNGIIEVTKKLVNLHTYDSLDKAVYRSDIIDFNISPDQLDGSSEFLTFLKNISPTENLLQVVGFLLSRYKSPDQGLSVILIDEGVDEENPESSGGRGKSLILEAIDKLRNVESLDGKNIAFNRFLFQSVNHRTNTVHFDDAQDNFEFEKLYSALTGNLIVEKKGLKPINIPFKKSPKFVISTNYLVKGTGGYSEERRKLIVGTSDYYGKHLSPKQEFGFLFFDEFTEHQWNDFYNTMFLCVQEYLKKGLPKSESNKEAEKEILLDTSKLFVDFMNRIDLELDIEYCLSDLFTAFKEFTPELRRINSRTFYKWVRKYLDFNGFQTIKHLQSEGKNYFNKRQGVSYFTLIKK